jgi:hypothetical protein
MQKLSHFVRFASMIAAASALAACSADAEQPQGPIKNGSNGSSSSGGGSSGGGSSGGGSSGGGTSSGGGSSSGGGTSSGGGSSSGGAAGNCPDIGGQWNGTVEGLAKGPQDAEPNKPVTGTASATFVAADKGNFDINPGTFDVTIEMGGIIGNVNAQQALQGKVTCGKLDATSSADVAGQQLSGTATCEFKGNECAGEWVANDADGNLVAKGTFNVKK